MYDNAFFQKNLRLEIEEIAPFIFYAEEKGLDASFLEKGRELDLIEFLMEQRKSFPSVKD
jgi:hypothetical protein